MRLTGIISLLTVSSNAPPFDAQEQGIVHDVEIAKELGIIFNLLLNEGTIALKHDHEVFPCFLIQSYEILVFQSLETASRLCHLRHAIDSRSFEIEDPLDQVLSLDLHGVRHEHQVDWAEALDFYRIDAVDTSQERGFILF